ncbi:C-reactive protein-like 1, partial [Homarus americanus]
MGEVEVRQDEWIHLCLWYDHTQTTRRLYVAGHQVAQEHFTAPRPFFLNGTLVVGQEQDDYPGGGFDWYQSFGGKVTLVQLWNKPLPDGEIQKLGSCNTDTERDLLDWESAPFELQDSPKWDELPVSELCRPPAPPIIIFPEMRTMPATRKLCAVMGGELSVPQNAKENELMMTLLEDHSSTCGRRVGLWLGATDEQTEGVWRNMATNNILTFMPFTSRQPDGQRNENCLLLDYTRAGWSDWSCSVSNQFCSSCSFPAIQVYILRGLCEPDTTNTVFSLRGYRGGRPYWRGLFNYQVEYQDSHWILLDLWTNTTVATLEALSITKYPDGINMWTVMERLLSLTRCMEGKFTCTDGSCVSESQRCDLRNQCSDGSDEDGCHNVITPLGYRSNLPPAPVLANHTATPISLLMQLERFSKIDTLNMEVSLDYIVEVNWLDSRLTFTNLKPPPKVNILLVSLTH